MSVSQNRLEAIERVRQGWISRLIDLSRRNNLLYYRESIAGSIDFTGSDPEQIDTLLRGESVPLTRLVSPEERDRAIACIQKIYRRSLTNLEEKGLQTLFLALGMASWTPDDAGRPPEADDAGRPPEAAVILIPVRVEIRGEIKIRRSGEAQINPVLLHVLDAKYRCPITPQDLLEGAESIAEDEYPDLSLIAERFQKKACEIKGFEIKTRRVLGNFSFQKMAMVRDLRERLQEMADHNLIAAIAGDEDARQTIRDNRTEFDVKELDRSKPDREFLVFDADSSQQKVIREVLSKRNCVIQGPPGTGKSQTIANLIASLAAEGFKILFVAEKRAALEVVQKRLQQRGLGHLLLDFHNADISRRAVMEQFAESLRLVRDAPRVDFEDAHRQFVDRRKRLNDQAARIHEKRSPSGKSVFDLQGELLGFSQEERNDIRFRGETLKRLTPTEVNRVNGSLQELGGESMAALFLGNQISPWMDSKFSTSTDVERALERVERIAKELYPDLKSSVSQFVAATRFESPLTLDQVREQVELVESVAVTLSRYSEKLFQENLERRIKELEPLKHGFPSESVAWVFNGDFKNAVYTLRDLKIKRDISDREILQNITKAAKQLERWRLLTSTNSTPCKVPNVQEVRKRLDSLVREITAFESLLNRRNLSRMPLNEFADLFSSLLSERDIPRRMTRVRNIERELEGLGIGSFLNELKRTRPDPTLWERQFKYAWLSSCLDRAYSEIPELISFDGRNHERVIQEFRDLDRERLDLAVQRVYRAHAERAIEAMNWHPRQEDLVRREAERRSRHLPLRKLLAQAPDVLTALRPCWMASPLSVSQLLDADRRYFDVVIFDEASQVLPEDAIPAILRAERVVIAGDEYQLPPTKFFATGADESEEESDSPTAGIESLLKLMSPLLESKIELKWHYRSRCEELIAFSNRHIYGDRLITFPNPARSGCVSHVLVSSDFDRDGQEESSSGEVQRVVDLVLEQAIEYPDRTLGVIAMGIKHANRIEAALDQALKNRPELGAFFDYRRSERFFIKNIERVQGDERDVIILSVGYGKDRSGRLPYRFGPLLSEGGERRLNVAITRARQRLILVSSFDHCDMNPDRSKAEGVKLLRLYLEYAASEGRILGDSQRSNEPENPSKKDVHVASEGQVPGDSQHSIEKDVYKALKDRDIDLVERWGVSRYRIDMVAQHPKQASRFVLAIECDGASYHSLPTVRERDRLRQQQLEALGWRFHRIWSTDWFTRRETEIERAVAAYEAAVQYAEQIDAQEVRLVQQSPVELPVSSESIRSTSDTQLRRELRPDVPQRDKIDQYSIHELITLIRWILSDGYLRTDDEIVQEMVRELGFKKRGVRIQARVLEALQKVKESSGMFDQ